MEAVVIVATVVVAEEGMPLSLHPMVSKHTCIAAHKSKPQSPEPQILELYKWEFPKIGDPYRAA